MKDHHGKCAKAQAWDVPGVPCTCPPGWPRTVREQPKAEPLAWTPERKARLATKRSAFISTDDIDAALAHIERLEGENARLRKVLENAQSTICSEVLWP